MRASEIRSRFLAYFERQHHAVRPSASLVPGDDPTLLWVCDWLVPALRRTPDEIGNVLRALDGRHVESGPSGAPTRGMAHDAGHIGLDSLVNRVALYQALGGGWLENSAGVSATSGASPVTASDKVQ